MSPEDTSQRKAWISQLWIVDGQMEMMVTVSTEPVKHAKACFLQALAALLSFNLCDCSLRAEPRESCQRKRVSSGFCGFNEKELVMKATLLQRHQEKHNSANLQQHTGPAAPEEDTRNHSGQVGVAH